ncbi:protein-S-isoprenylcysteine O-methyltransferase Ste14 [Melghirimyces profundicolus]|uniref:Protein-S-isoprenylcysteine O-methyltransferase Ste14 n=1 Tax=Melghirimyces profundicolus TaxID=1242148 RepID=A0A2T6C890_9BACL|nr:isoprenylcysteine carboxylmethyltransferase family protein [Melghirimyces profundicolus]PTX64525.1 protein-S-isoprenylcysteine O-methyltransferase Ste14 [Melghirimyces profundicolus]
MLWLSFTPVILYLLLETLRKQPQGERRKDRTSTLVLAAALAWMTLVPTWVLLSRPTDFSLHPPFFYTGLATGIAGVWFRAKAMQTLGRFFSRNIGIQNRHRVVDTGCYRYIRHPGYLGTMGTFVGFALSTGSGVVVLANLLCFLTAYSFRMQMEERALVAHFGSVYSEYQARTWKLIPCLY